MQYILSQCTLQRKAEKKTNIKSSHAPLKALVVPACSCDSKTFEGKRLSLGQYPGESIINWDFWEGKPLVQILNTSPSGVLPYALQVSPPLAALHKDDLNMAVFTPEPTTFGEVGFFFFQKLGNTCEACSHLAYEARSTATRTSLRKNYVQQRIESYL